jgi:hypothetical protein
MTVDSFSHRPLSQQQKSVIFKALNLPDLNGFFSAKTPLSPLKSIRATVSLIESKWKMTKTFKLLKTKEL